MAQADFEYPWMGNNAFYRPAEQPPGPPELIVLAGEGDTNVIKMNVSYHGGTYK